MIHDYDMDDDKNVDDMDVATEDATTTTNVATHSMNLLPEQPNGDNDDDGNRLRKQQQQYQNLDTWLQLIQTAIQPFQQQNQMLLKNITNRTRHSPQYIVQSGILSSNDKNYPTDVVGSAMVKTTSITTNSYVNTAATTTETTTSTILMATVTLQVGQPSIVAPKQGDITITLNCNNNNNNSTIGASASHTIQTIQSKIQRIFDENMDLEQLHIIEGKMAYRVVVTITILFVETITSITLFDSCLLAASAALLDTKLPTHPIINDGILYSTPTASTTTCDHCDHTGTPVASSTSGIVSNVNIETKPLYMPVIPISFTAIGVRLPISTVTNTLTSNETGKNHKTELHWIGDPTIEEQQIYDSMTVTVVMNAAPMTSMSEDHHHHEEEEEEDDEEEEVLYLQVTPTTGTTTIDPSLTALKLSSNHTDLSTITSSATTALSWIDLENVMSMALRHVKSLNKLIKLK